MYSKVVKAYFVDVVSSVTASTLAHNALKEDCEKFRKMPKGILKVLYGTTILVNYFIIVYSTMYCLTTLGNKYLLDDEEKKEVNVD